MTMQSPPRIDAATRKARARNLRRRQFDPVRPRLDAPPTLPREGADCPAPLDQDKLDQLRSGWTFLE